MGFPQLRSPFFRNPAGAQSLTVAFIAAASVLFAPTTAYEVQLPSVSAGTVSAPVVVYQATGPTIASGETLFSPTVAAEAAGIVKVQRSSSWPRPFAPNPFLQLRSKLQLALAAVGDQGVSLPTVSGTAVTPPSVIYEAGLPSISGSAVFAPQIAYALSLPTIAETVVFSPATAYQVAGELISATTLFPMTVASSDQTLELATIASGSSILSPILAYAVGEIPFISATSVFTPAVSGGISSGGTKRRRRKPMGGAVRVLLKTVAGNREVHTGE